MASVVLAGVTGLVGAYYRMRANADLQKELAPATDDPYELVEVVPANITAADGSVIRAGILPDQAADVPGYATVAEQHRRWAEYQEDGGAGRLPDRRSLDNTEELRKVNPDAFGLFDWDRIEAQKQVIEGEIRADETAPLEDDMGLLTAKTAPRYLRRVPVYQSTFHPYELTSFQRG